MAGTDLTILVALAAGVISFLSPCVLPLVPAYLGQLTAIAVAGSAPGAQPSRWLAVRHALAYVAGFGAVFTRARHHGDLRGGSARRLPAAAADDRRGRAHRPRPRPGRPAPHPGPRADLAAARRRRGGSLATTTGTTVVRARRRGSAERRRPHRRPHRRARAAAGSRRSGSARSSPIGWSPCIGIILGGILTLAATSGTALQGAILLVAYTIGLGLPFLLIAAVFDRAPRVMAPLVRHGRTVSLIGGLLVVAHRRRDALRLARLLPRYFNFNTAI